jgi:hypothetical protein
MASKSGSKIASSKMFNNEFVAENGSQYATFADVRAPHEPIQEGDRFFIPDYAVVIAQPYTFKGANGKDVTIMVGERIPAVKLDRRGKPITGTVLWVSQLCPRDVNNVHAFDTELDDARQSGTLLAMLKGRVVTAMESTTIMGRVWDKENGGYKKIDDYTYASAPKVVFRWAASAKATSLDVAKADELLKNYLDESYPGIFA